LLVEQFYDSQGFLQTFGRFLFGNADFSIEQAQNYLRFLGWVHAGINYCEGSEASGLQVCDKATQPFSGNYGMMLKQNIRYDFDASSL
jgi:hypothetical protein